MQVADYSHLHVFGVDTRDAGHRRKQCVLSEGHYLQETSRRRTAQPKDLTAQTVADWQQ